MPSAVASRGRQPASSLKASQPPAKKAKLSQLSNGTRPNGLEKMLSPAGSAKKPRAAIVNGAKDARAAQVDESRLKVQAGGGTGDVDMEDAPKEIVEISSDDEEEEEEEADELDEDDVETDSQDEDQQPTAASAKDAVMVNGQLNGEPHEDEDEESAEPSFGEILQANAPEPIDVDATFEGRVQESNAVVPASDKRIISIPSATSLGTVLTQALRTNDRELLESCFQLNELDSVRTTIERLPSPLVADLLQRLAERIHKRPGRAGNLMLWVQWSLVAHGGYLAGRGEVVSKLRNLNNVIKARASGLQSLLALKGKLDMLSAQLELRRKMQRPAGLEDFEDEAIIYVEGEDENTSDEDGDQIEGGSLSAITSRKRAINSIPDIGESESSGDEEGMPTAMNGVESEDDSEDDEDDMLDDEAEETENDTGDDLSEDDSVEEDDAQEHGEGLSGSDEDERPRKRTVGSSRSAFSRK